MLPSFAGWELRRWRCLPRVVGIAVLQYGIGRGLARFLRLRVSRDPGRLELIDDELRDDRAQLLPERMVRAPVDARPEPRQARVVGQAAELLPVLGKEFDQQPGCRRGVRAVAGR